ncbi:TetR/AcrR family transcriptional regulator [Ornithinibacillus bavariensis]|uniref:TetR/AcrR family transcriptional regulator n=1 Tax=Ornithinibacillus bavariensis TaxID=545502 RepID=UPI000EF08A04|nr:TetR/AcrR family transcriptional regulator [Ornithinibacillus sp.]
MSRGFNEHEKQVITNSLIEQGRILFSKMGFQKTSIHEITQNVGIAQGTFYKFFSSKEELYFAILEIEEEKIREQFVNLKVSNEDQPKKIIKGILRNFINAIETNPLIRELYFGSNMEEMLKRLSPELLEKHFAKDSDAILALIEKWRALGIQVKEDPAIIAGVLRSLFVLTLHEKEIGEAVYPDTLELLIDLIVDGLIEED